MVYCTFTIIQSMLLYTAMLAKHNNENFITNALLNNYPVMYKSDQCYPVNYVHLVQWC